MPDLVPIRRALLSVSDKTGLAEFASALVNEFHVELISTGGTAKFLRDAGLPVKDVSEITGFPEMMDGRVKTLHPNIHGGLLALRDHADHLSAMKAHDIQPIDLVCINLYPFAKTIEKPGVTFEEAIENIDIGGPSMIRSAAKNHAWVLVVTSPDRYEKVLGDLREHGGSSCGKHRLKQAQRAFQNTAEYDAKIADYLEEQLDQKPVKMNFESRFTLPEGTPGGAKKLPRNMLAKLRDLKENAALFLQTLIRSQAVVVNGTEAAAFLIEHAAGGRIVAAETIVHIRPDQATEETLASAVSAFKGIIKPSIEQDKNGVILIEGTESAKGPQYCLITLLREGRKSDRLPRDHHARRKPGGCSTSAYIC